MIQLLFLLGFLGIAVWYVLTLYNTFKAIPPECRTMEPSMVWLLCIPFFTFFWQFIVARRLSDSIRAAFVKRGISVEEQPTYTLGIINGVVFVVYMFAAKFLPASIAGMIGLLSIGLWIAYWVTVANYQKKLKQLPPEDFSESAIFGNSIQ